MLILSRLPEANYYAVVKIAYTHTTHPVAR
jgi:hypothetical protein